MVAGVTAAHHGFELSNGIGLVWQPELGLVGASAMWGTQIPLWITLAAKGSKRWDKLLAVWSGAALGAALLHFLLWPLRRGNLGIPVLAEAEGLVLLDFPPTTPSYTHGAQYRRSRSFARYLGATDAGVWWGWPRCRSCAFRHSTTFPG
jgi:hypothetical protein